MNLSDMAARGFLEPLAGTPEELNDLLAMARRHLADAQLTGLSAESCLVHAYQAILACAMVALRARDYRVPNIDGKHVRALESLKHTLGVDSREVEYFQSLRRKRHEDIYEGMLHASDMEAQDALEAARRLVEVTENDLRQRFPGLLEG